MTNEEYNRAYRRARSGFSALLASEKRKLKKIYKAAADETAELLKTLELAGRSSLTIESQSMLENQLRNATTRISQEIPDVVTDAVGSSYDAYARIDAEYVADAAKAAGLVEVITQDGVYAAAQAVNEQLVNAVFTKVYSDGYGFSTRVWEASQVYQDSIKDLVSMGLANNRDLFKIARDIQVYAADGKVKLMKRYGQLEAGSAEFRKRIPKNVDWRAVRLVRSELYSGLQAAGVNQASINPGATGVFEWRLSSLQQHDCVCIDYAEIKFFKKEDLPDYPHPNCICLVIPVLKPQRELVDDLKRWSAGENIEYLNNWSRVVGL